MWSQTNATSNDPSTSADVSASDGEIVRFAPRARANGLRVLFKPTVVAVDGTQFGELLPSDPGEWMANYGRLVVNLARTAQSANVSAMSVGLELGHISSDSRVAPLCVELIAKFRAVYCRLMTYCAAPFEPPKVTFWDHVDFIGIDLYVPFIFDRSDNASLVMQYSEMLKNNSVGMDHMFHDWYSNSKYPSLGIKVVITESGYPSSNKGMQFPWLFPDTDVGCTGKYAANFTAQASATEVQLKLLSEKYRNSFEGYFHFWWGVPGSKDYYVDHNKTDSLWGCGWTAMGKIDTMIALRTAFRRQ